MAKSHSDGESQDIFDNSMLKLFEDHLWGANFFSVSRKLIQILYIHVHNIIVVLL